MSQKKQLKNPTLAMWLSIIPGLGQFYNGQKVKAGLLLGVFLLEIVELVTFGIPAMVGLITLGSTPVIDHSLFLLIKGSMQLIIFVLMAIIHAVSMSDAKNTARLINDGQKVPMTAKETLETIYEKGFPYLLIIPAYLAMAFAIVFPVLVTLFIAFTNYDFRHIPPQKLLDWVGLKNFSNIVQLSTFRKAFSNVLSWTFIWTICASSLQIVIGVATDRDWCKDKLRCR